MRDVRANLVGELIPPGDSNWDEARLAWHLAVDQRPAAVAIPENVHDVIEIVNWAGEAGFQITAQGTGHNAPALGDLAGTVLVKMHKLKGVSIDADARIARVNAGAIWIEVVHAAAEHGLARSPARRRTSGSSVTRSAGASRGSRASTASARTRSLRSSS